MLSQTWSWASFYFHAYVRPFIHCLYFICERKFYALSHVKITRQRKSTLRQVVEVASSSKYLISQVACIADVSSGTQMFLLAKAPCWNRREEEKGRVPPFLLSPSHLPLGLLFLLSSIFHCHKIKDGGYNNANTNKVSPTQNTPALQAHLKYL